MNQEAKQIQADFNFTRTEKYKERSGNSRLIRDCVENRCQLLGIKGKEINQIYNDVLRLIN